MRDIPLCIRRPEEMILRCIEHSRRDPLPHWHTTILGDSTVVNRSHRLLPLSMISINLVCRRESTGWGNVKPLPGANRLLKHLKAHGVPMALASNSSREGIQTKICH